MEPKKPPLLAALEQLFYDRSDPRGTLNPTYMQVCWDTVHQGMPDTNNIFTATPIGLIYQLPAKLQQCEWMGENGNYTGVNIPWNDANAIISLVDEWSKSAPAHATLDQLTHMLQPPFDQLIHGIMSGQAHICIETPDANDLHTTIATIKHFMTRVTTLELTPDASGVRMSTDDYERLNNMWHQLYRAPAKPIALPANRDNTLPKPPATGDGSAPSESLHQALIGLFGDPSYPDYREALRSTRITLDSPLSQKPANDIDSILKISIFGITDAHIPLNQGSWVKNAEGQIIAFDLSPERLQTIALKTFNRAHLLRAPYDEIAQKIQKKQYRVLIEPADPKHVDAHMRTAMAQVPSSRPNESGRFWMRARDYDTLHQKWLDSCNRRLFSSQQSLLSLTPTSHFALRSIFENYEATLPDALMRATPNDAFHRAGDLSLDTLNTINSREHTILWPTKDSTHALHVVALITQELPTLSPALATADIEGKTYISMHSSVHDLLTKSWDAAKLEATKKHKRIPTGQVTDGTVIPLQDYRDRKR